MKKLFILLMCFIGYLSSIDAQVIEHYVGAESTGNNAQSPTYESYRSGLNEYIFLEEELGNGELLGEITSFAFKQCTNKAIVRKFVVHMKHTDKENFTHNQDFLQFTDEDCYIAEVELTYPKKDGWLVFTLDRPFKYEGGNLAIAITDVSGYVSDYQRFYTYTPSDNKQYRVMTCQRDLACDATTILDEISQNGPVGIQARLRGWMPTTRFTIKTEFNYSVIEVEPKELDLGFRPNNSWMRPYEVYVKTKGNELTVNAIGSSNPYFTIPEIELPANITITEPMVLEVSHTAGQGEMEGQIAISLDMSKSLELVDIKATAYDPVTSDVWELAEPITSYPFTATPDLTNIYPNYLLPGNSENGKDVVYELNFNKDVALNASVVGTNGKIAVYAEDFNGKGGPMEDNNYVGINSVNAVLTENSIDGLGLPAGKYYLVASSTSDFTVNVDVEAIPLPEKAFNPNPANYSQNVSNPNFKWEFGEYTTEFQLLFGSTYPPEEIIVDWTDSLADGYSVTDLHNNTNYFWRVNARNSSGTTYGDVWGFTTRFDYPKNLTILDDKIYEGETATITWDPIGNRSHLGYNVYIEQWNTEGWYNEWIKINTTPVKDTTYTFTELSYNMEPGHKIGVSAIYDEGESEVASEYYSYIKVSGYGNVSGMIYEQDGFTPVTSGGVVNIEGKDEYGVNRSYTFQVDETGSFSGEILVGEYKITSVFEGYMDGSDDFKIKYNETTDVALSIIENFDPVKYITAKEVDNHVEVAWGMQRYGNGADDFETGDFSVNEWNNEVSSYPWAITENAYEGSYAMKSTCEGVNSGVSAIEITVDVPYDAVMSFYHKVSSEYGWDMGYFYIDGAVMANVSSEMDWKQKEFRVSEGIHTYRWEYAKDGSYDEGLDAYFVDNVILYQEPEPFTGGWITYDDGMFATCIGTGIASPVYWGATFPYASEYTGFTINKLSVFDAPDSGVAGSANATANVYIGGTTAPETLVSTTAFTLTGCNDYVEVELETPVTIDGTQPIWVIFYCDELAYPAAGCAHTGDANGDWLSLDGVEWGHSPEFGVAYTWMVAAHLTNAKGQTAVFSTSSKAPKFEGGASTGEFVANANATPRYVGSVAGETKTMNAGTRAFASYNIYKRNIYTDVVELLLEKTNDTTYIDNAWATDEAGVYQWGASAYYEGNRDINAYFAESFESSSIPEGWTLYNTSAPGQESHIIDRQLWTPVKSISSNGFDFYPADGEYFLLGDEDGPLTYQQAWDLEYSIITPAIEVKPLSRFTMDYICPSYDWLPTWRTNIEVKIATSMEGPWTSLWSTNDVRSNEWEELEINLGDYSGQIVYIMFSHTALKDWGWFAGIDNVKITSFVPESEILWSKSIDKDMTTTVTVNAQTDNGDPVKGTNVSFINLIEEGLDITATLDESGSIVFDNFRKGTYELSIFKNGYVSDAEGVVVEIWDDSEFNALLTEELASVEDLYVSPTGWAMWKGRGIGTGDEFMFDFEDGILTGWSTIDADGDSFNWVNSNDVLGAGYGHNGSNFCALSQSYDNWTGVLYPDNYLVTAEKYSIGGSSQLTFWACAQDASWAAEHFGVAVSTVGNTSAADFTTIAEWTVGEKAANAATRGSRDQSEWVQYTVDLSEYAGQEVYIAIRHFNCSDQYFLDVDDVALVNAGKADRALVKYQVLLDGIVEDDSVVVPYYQHENLVDGTKYTTTVIASYTMGDSEEMSYSWTKLSENIFAPVKNFEAIVNNNNYEVTLSWTLPKEESEDDDEEEEQGTSVMFDFDDGTLTGWVTVDGDGDGFTWVNSSEILEPGSGNNGSNYFALSQSYINNYGPLNPDNYLATAEKYAITSGSKISFYACAQDENYPYEHFGVAVSTAGNTSASDFTTISEWTINAKGGGQGDRAMRQSSWVKYEADLSAYAGQEVYIAIRHFNCTDQYFLNIDDVEIISGETSESKDGNWMSYDDDTYVDGVGGPASFYWGIKLRTEDLGQYAPAGLTKIAFYDRIATSGEFYIYLGGDTAPEELVHTQQYTCTGIDGIVEYELTETIQIYGTENVWVVFHTNDGVNYPASCCNNTGDADGRWISIDGNTWQDLVDVGLNYTWMIRAYLDNNASDIPPVAEILGVMMYKNGELVSSKPIAGESYTDKDGQIGDEYCVKVVYGGEMDETYYGMSNPICAEAEFNLDCEAPKDLYAEVNDNDVTLKLSYNPNPVGEWLYYDNGVNEDAIGGPESFYWGIMFPAANLEAYEGTSITKVALFDYVASSGNINIYYGGTSAPQDLIHTQPYSVTGTGDFVEFDLTAALPIDPTMNVWVAFSTSQGASYPAAVCADMGDPNSRWISMDGAVWEDLAGYGLNNTWMMRAYVTNAKGEVSSLAPITDYEYTTGVGEVKASGVAKATNELSHYNVYRGTSTNNFEKIGESTSKTYVDEDLADGTYYYQMTAVYAANGEECESDPANAYGSDDNYVVVDVTAIDENGVKGMMVYPNPTQGDLNIYAENITRIVITNTLGQVIYDQEVNTDNKVINMSQYEGGVYMVRIVTANGVAIERVTVVK